MKFSFEATIYKAGINPCVKVPVHITGKMSVVKGYIYVREKIEGHSFQQTLVPVKNEGYRLYVNGLMLKGSDSKPGDTVKFIIEQDPIPRTLDSYPMPEEFKKALEENNLFAEFKNWPHPGKGCPIPKGQQLPVKARWLTGLLLHKGHPLPVVHLLTGFHLVAGPISATGPMVLTGHQVFMPTGLTTVVTIARAIAARRLYGRATGIIVIIIMLIILIVLIIMDRSFTH